MVFVERVILSPLSVNCASSAEKSATAPGGFSERRFNAASVPVAVVSTSSTLPVAPVAVEVNTSWFCVPSPVRSTIDAVTPAPAALIASRRPANELLVESMVIAVPVTAPPFLSSKVAVAVSGSPATRAAEVEGKLAEA